MTANSITHTTNPTDVIKIHKQRFTIDIEKDFDGNKYFNYKEINLKGLELDRTALVYLYLISGQIEIKFDLGTVNRPIKPSNRFIGQLRGLKFRLLVVDKDTQRIIASAEHVSAKSLNQDKRDSLIPVETDSKLGNEIWKLPLIDGAQPILYLNQKYPYVENLIANDYQTVALIYPQVMRLALMHYINNPTDNATDAWQYKWYRFIKEHGFNKTEIPSSESTDSMKFEFIDKVIEKWLKNIDIFSLAVTAINNRKSE